MFFINKTAQADKIAGRFFKGFYDPSESLELPSDGDPFESRTKTMKIL